MNSSPGGIWLPKRWLSALVIFLCVLTLYLLAGSQKNLLGYHASFKATYQEGALPPILGSIEDETRLYYPAIGSNFNPRPAPYNIAKVSEPRLRTPLFLACTRNSELLEQAVLSYIVAGWPREDIIIIDNTGTMDANSKGQLSTDNPFFLDYKLFREKFGVSILQTHTLLTFAQLQNFYLRLSMAHNWRFFFWGHMDVVVLSDEGVQPYKSFYQRVLEILDKAGMRELESLHKASKKVKKGDWANKYFAYDWLSLINVPVWREIGSWDPFIPYYIADCDAYSRISMNGYEQTGGDAGHVFDISAVIPDLESKLLPSATELSNLDWNNLALSLNSSRHQDLVAELKKVMAEKPARNREEFQSLRNGGRGEPWTYDPKGFQQMWWDTAEAGIRNYETKWGTRECRLTDHGVTLARAWNKTVDIPEEKDVPTEKVGE